MGVFGRYLLLGGIIWIWDWSVGASACNRLPGLETSTALSGIGFVTYNYFF